MKPSIRYVVVEVPDRSSRLRRLPTTRPETTSNALRFELSRPAHLRRGDSLGHDRFHGFAVTENVNSMFENERSVHTF